MTNATQTMIENLHKNSGKTLEQRIDIVKKIENLKKVNMKKILLLAVSFVLLNLTGNNSVAQPESTADKSNTLCILWTSADPEVATKMVFMYANAAIKNKWFEQVELIIWGPSAKLTSENKEIQDYISKMQENGVKIEACKACADLYGVTDNLKSLGIDVKYMGQPLTEILKSDKKLITF